MTVQSNMAISNVGYIFLNLDSQTIRLPLVVRSKYLLINEIVILWTYIIKIYVAYLQYIMLENNTNYGSKS